MRGARLQRFSILHHRLDRICIDRAREPFVFRFCACKNRHRQHVFGKTAVHFERAQRFDHRVFGIGVCSMPFLPQEFAGAQEHARAHFPTHDIGPLVGQHRQIAP